MDLTTDTEPTPRVRPARTPDQQRHANARAITRRQLLRDNNVCINGQMPRPLAKRVMRRPMVVHGAPVPGKGGRCQRCADIHAESRSKTGQRAHHPAVREVATAVPTTWSMVGGGSRTTLVVRVIAVVNTIVPVRSSYELELVAGAA